VRVAETGTQVVRRVGDYEIGAAVRQAPKDFQTVTVLDRRWSDHCHFGVISAGA
jgi:hypothetical protein